MGKHTEQRIEAMKLLVDLDIKNWVTAGCKSYRGQSKLKHAIAYLCESVAE